MTLVANVRVNTQVPFPSLARGVKPVTISKEQNGLWTAGLAFQNLEVLSLVDPPNDYVLVWDSVANTYFRSPLDAVSGGGGGPAGVEVVGTLNQIGLTNVAGPFSLLSGGAAADVNGIYQVSLYLMTTTGDGGAAAQLYFRLFWTDDSGPTFATFRAAQAIALTAAGNALVETVPIYNIAGSDITVETLNGGGPGFGAAVYSLRARVIKLELPV